MKSACSIFLGACIALAGCSQAAGGLGTAGSGLIPSGHANQAQAAMKRKSGPSDPTIYLFQGTPDAGTPYAGLLNVGGTFYGTGDYNGASNLGAVFSVTPGGTEKVLHSFSGSDGAYPYASLIDVKGTLYGTTTGGGASNEGCIFSITKSGKESILYSFTGFSDGAHPIASLLYYQGALYGTTQNGGNSTDYGVVFKFPLNGKMLGPEVILHSFLGDRSDGASPQGALVASNGVLYGTAAKGDINNAGIIYSVTPSGGYTVRYMFAGGSDGATPEAPLLADKGHLYGTTFAGGTQGGGTIFDFSPKTGTEKILHNFGASGDGSGPAFGGLTNAGGTFYGTTEYGAGGGNYGSVFSITPAGTYSQLAYFTNPPGTPNYPDYPLGSVIVVNGVLYGTTSSNEGAVDGGIGAGTVFALSL